MMRLPREEPGCYNNDQFPDYQYPVAYADPFGRALEQPMIDHIKPMGILSAPQTMPCSVDAPVASQHRTYAT